MMGIRGTSMLLLGILLWMLLHSTFSQNAQHNRNRGQRNSEMAELVSAIHEAGSVVDEAHPFHSLTPTTPSPENINCFVEIVPPIRMGGVCKRMGRSGRRRGRGGRTQDGRRRRPVPVMWACQAGVHLEIGSPHCGSSQNRRFFRQMMGG